MKLGKTDIAIESQLGRIGRGVNVTGDVLFADELQIEGGVKGTLTSENGSLVIEQPGQVEAEINVGVCIIRGTLKGNLKARSRVEIYGTARVNGDVTTPVLLVEEGAVLSGAILMGEESPVRALEEVRSEEQAARHRSTSA